jgi:hypothetical protein
MNSPKKSDKKLSKKFGKKKPKYIKNFHNKVDEILDNKIENDTYFINSILKCYHIYYVNYFRFIRQIHFQIDVNSLIENKYQKINCIYHGKRNQINFLYIGHVLSNKLYWVNNFHKFFYENYFKKNKIFDKFNLSDKFLKDFFYEDYIDLNHELILRFIFYLINMMNKYFKIIDVKDPITKISVIGIIQINYFDDFDLYKHFLNVY